MDAKAVEIAASVIMIAVVSAFVRLTYTVVLPLAKVNGFAVPPIAALRNVGAVPFGPACGPLNVRLRVPAKLLIALP